jgi:hypothetical protein
MDAIREEAVEKLKWSDREIGSMEEGIVPVDICAN